MVGRGQELERLDVGTRVGRGVGLRRSGEIPLSAERLLAPQSSKKCMITQTKFSALLFDVGFYGKGVSTKIGESQTSELVSGNLGSVLGTKRFADLTFLGVRLRFNCAKEPSVGKFRFSGNELVECFVVEFAVQTPLFQSASNQHGFTSVFIGHSNVD